MSSCRVCQGLSIGYLFVEIGWIFVEKLMIFERIACDSCDLKLHVNGHLWIKWDLFWVPLEDLWVMCSNSYGRLVQRTVRCPKDTLWRQKDLRDVRKILALSARQPKDTQSCMRRNTNHKLIKDDNENKEQLWNAQRIVCFVLFFCAMIVLQ